MVNENFADRYHKMKETHNYCFGSKNCNTNLRQAKTDKHECRKITVTTASVLTYFQLTKYCVTFFRTGTIVANFLQVMVLICKTFIKYFSKRQFVELLLACITYQNFVRHKVLKHLIYLFKIYVWYDYFWCIKQSQLP